MTAGAAHVDGAPGSHDELSRALGALARGSREAYVAVAVPAPAVAVTRVHDAFDAPRFCWAPPAADDWSLATSGEVARVDASGADRFAEVRVRGSALLDRVETRALDGALALSPRLVGGFAFAPRGGGGDPAEAPWAQWPDASFALPRWTYAVRGSSAVLVLALAAAELADADAWADRLRLVLEALEASQPGGVSSSAARSRTSIDAWPASRPSALPEMCTTPVGAESFVASVAAALAAIDARRFDKVVVAGRARVLGDADLDASLVLARLSAAYPETTRFAVSRGGKTFLGATPERLVDRRGRAVEIDALAGTVRRSSRPDEDAALLCALASSGKDLAEHRVVVRAIRDAVAPLCADLAVPVDPAARSLRNVSHLWTLVRGTLRDDRHVLELVERLHPTPAVAGFPREPALAWLAEHEPMVRGWYAGGVGWFDRSGDGSFGVALRCGLLERRCAWVFAGAGIVQGSDPHRELQEVRAKQQAILAALGVMP